MMNFTLRKLLLISLLTINFVSHIPTSYANWNNPYSDQDAEDSVLYSSFSQRPKHFDPIRSYGQDEYVFIRQIYESPLQYHFLKRTKTTDTNANAYSAQRARRTG